MAYAQDYEETLPFRRYRYDLGTKTVFNEWFCQNFGDCRVLWADMLLPYVKNTQLFACPSDTIAWRAFDPRKPRLSYAMNYYAFGYGLNSLPTGPGPSLVAIPRPAERVLVSEAREGLDFVALFCRRAPSLNHDRTYNTCTPPLRGLDPNQIKGGVVTVYFDGHSKLFRMHGILSDGCGDAFDCVRQYYPEWLPALDQ